MSSSPIPSFLVSNVSKSLRVLTKNERPWAIRSGPSEKMSNCEQITQVAHQKWVNEWIAHFLSKSLIRIFLCKKRAIHLENQWANSQPWFIMFVYYVCFLCLFILLIYLCLFIMFDYYVCLINLFIRFVYYVCWKKDIQVSFTVVRISFF